LGVVTSRRIVAAFPRDGGTSGVDVYATGRFVFFHDSFPPWAQVCNIETGDTFTIELTVPVTRVHYTVGSLVAFAGTSRLTQFFNTFEPTQSFSLNMAITMLRHPDTYHYERLNVAIELPEVLPARRTAHILSCPTVGYMVIQSIDVRDHPDGPVVTLLWFKWNL
jgi:hypothetical protein